MATYNINGVEISPSPDIFDGNRILVCDTYDGTQYYLIRIMKKKTDGTFQYPFVIAPHGTGAANKSALDYATENDVKLIINAGLFAMGSGDNPLGSIIQNGVVVQDSRAETRNLLTIDSSGNLDYVIGDTDPATLVANGIKSAVLAFAPLIVNYQKTAQADYPKPEEWSTGHQRQVIGQFGNGDYGILTTEGRNNDNSAGLDLGKIQDILVSYNFKFAFNLDGGGSVETVLGKKQLNTIYENTTGRKVPTFIVFNGTDEY